MLATLDETMRIGDVVKAERLRNRWLVPTSQVTLAITIVPIDAPYTKDDCDHNCFFSKKSVTLSCPLLEVVDGRHERKGC